jgi:hypothetical protein
MHIASKEEQCPLGVFAKQPSICQPVWESFVEEGGLQGLMGREPVGQV